MQTLEHQLSAPSRSKDGSTPQPEEPLQIVMPTPAVVMGSTGMMPQAPPPVTAMPQSVAPMNTGSMALVAQTGHHQQPQFGFNEMSNMTLANLLSHVTVNEQVLATPERIIY